MTGYEFDMRHVFAAVLALAGAWAFVSGTQLLRSGVGGADHPSAPLRLVRGIRGIVVGLGAGAIASGILFGHTGFVVLGAVFLAEELYETGILILILRGDQPP
jgi:hypothetical protein